MNAKGFDEGCNSQHEGQITNIGTDHIPQGEVTFRGFLHVGAHTDKKFGGACSKGDDGETDDERRNSNAQGQLATPLHQPLRSVIEQDQPQNH